MFILKIIYIILVTATFFQESITASLPKKLVYPQPWYFYTAIRGVNDVVCGGTLIRKNWLISTAACINDCCAVGKNNRVVLTTYFTREDHRGTNSTSLPAQFFIHPEFQKFYRDSFHYNDLALIKVNTTTWKEAPQISTFPLSDVGIKATDDCEFPSFINSLASQFVVMNLSAKFFDCPHFLKFKHPNLAESDKAIMSRPDFCKRYGFIDLTMHNLPVWNIFGRGHPLLCNNKVYAVIMSNLVKNRGADDPLVGSQWTFSEEFIPWVSKVISAHEEIYYSQPNMSKPANTPSQYTGQTPAGAGGSGGSAGSVGGGTGEDSGEVKSDIGIKTSSAIDHFSQIGFLKALFYFFCVLLAPVVFKMN